MNTAFTLPAPAKLNLFLHVMARRPDGYHDIETLFQFLDHGDQLHFSPMQGSDIQLNATDTTIPTYDNLIFKAAKTLQSQSQCPLGVKITLEKILPMGGGLGGGSSDAATTLLALNHLWGLNWSLPQLAQLGLTLGADVPIFIHGQAAFAQGVGEHLTTCAPATPWYLVLIPPIHVPTASVFNHPALPRNTPSMMAQHQSNPQTIFEGSAWWHQTHNDCQNLVMQSYPEVKNALQWMSQYTEARLTGTGACVFGAFPTREDADSIARLICAPVKGFVAQGCNSSPTHKALKLMA